MPMSVETLRGHLTEAFPDAEIVIDDLAGDGDHYRARVSWPRPLPACRACASTSSSMPP